MVYPKKVDIDKIKRLREEGLTIREIAMLLKVSHNAIFKALKKEGLTKSGKEETFNVEGLKNELEELLKELKHQFYETKSKKVKVGQIKKLESVVNRLKWVSRF